MTRPIRIGKNYAVKAGKVVAKHVPRDASAARRERPGGSKKVRVVRGNR
jgi:serine acetyltransferase